MPDLPTIAGGPTTAGANAAASSGVTVTASASANTKGAWAELIASTPHRTDWLHLGFGAMSATFNGHLLDIGIGAAGSEVVVVPNIYLMRLALSTTITQALLLPLRLPAGGRLAARVQASGGGSATVDVAAHVIASPIAAPPGLSRVEPCGVSAATSQGTLLADPGATAHVDGAWTELIASTAFAYRWLCVTTGNSSDSSFAANVNHLLDIGIGASGSEIVVVDDVLLANAAGTSQMPVAVSLPVAMASGSRLAARHRCSSATAGDRRLTIAAYGVG